MAISAAAVTPTNMDEKQVSCPEHTTNMGALRYPRGQLGWERPEASGRRRSTITSLEKKIAIEYRDIN